MQRNQHPFNGLEQGPDFDRARSMIATPFQYVDIALDVAATDQIFNVSGDFLYCDAATTGAAELELNNQYNDSAAPFTLQQGFALECLFKQIKLSWTAQPGKKIRLLYSTGARIVPTNIGSITGTVSVVDVAIARSLQGQAFLGTAGVGPVAANYSLSQIFNPAGSGKSFYLEAVSFSSNTAQQIALGEYSTQLATDLGACRSKLLGGAASLSHLRVTNDPAILLALTGLSYTCSANMVQTINFSSPVVLSPGRGYVLIGLTANTSLSANFEGFES